jgi:hypothetical protein
LAWPWVSWVCVPLEWNHCPLVGVAPLFVLKHVWRVLCPTPLFLVQVERQPLKKRKSEAGGGPREAPGEADSGSEVTRSDDLPIIAGARESKAVTSKRAAPLKKTPLPARKPAEPLAFQGEDPATPGARSSGSQGLGTASRRAIIQETHLITCSTIECTISCLATTKAGRPTPPFFPAPTPPPHQCPVASSVVPPPLC